MSAQPVLTTCTALPHGCSLREQVGQDSLAVQVHDLEQLLSLQQLHAHAVQ